MAVTSVRSVTVAFTGDVEWTQEFDAASNAASPAQNDLVTLSSGANTITAPTGGSVPKGVTIIPPTNNDQTLTLKGVSGDTGIALHRTDPTSLALETGVSSFVLSAGGTITGVRIIWS